MVRTRRAVSLFSSAGIGDLGLAANGVEIIASNEIVAQRHALFKANFPTTACFTGSIEEQKSPLIEFTRDKLRDDDLFLLLATPPCQGMSTNGVGKLLAEMRAGNRPQMDERNQLILPTMEVVNALRPQWVILENVPGMRNTVILDRSGEPTNLLEFVRRTVDPDYFVLSEVISCSDFGIPQMRKRLITVLTRDPIGIKYLRSQRSAFPLRSRTNPITLREAIGHLPPLDPHNGPASRTDFHPLHYVQKMSPEKHWWVSNTPEGETAFNNQCVASACRFQGNSRHVDATASQRSKAGSSSALYCEKCSALLPRPSIIDHTGNRRLIKGFHSAYRRMRWDEPAPTLTRNFPFEASDNKLHPNQNRPLSIFEATVLQTIADYDFTFEIDGRPVNRKVIADVIGESVPPRLIDILIKSILTLSPAQDSPSTRKEHFAAV